MSKRIDEELEKAAKAGSAPTLIQVGDDFYWELQEEQNPVFAADVLGPYDKAQSHAEKEVIEYKGIKVVRLEGVASDYLKIL